MVGKRWLGLVTGAGNSDVLEYCCSVPKLQSCLGVGVENSGPKKAMRV